MKRTILLLLLLGLAAGLGWTVYERLAESAKPAAKGKGGKRPVPVAVAAVERGAIEARRTYSGTLEATAEFVVAPKVAGRIERIAVDLADPVNRGQVVAELDDAELQQAVAQAEADLAVEQAGRAEAQSSLAIAKRELDRIQRLQGSGVSSESALDTARLTELARRAELEVAEAQVKRAEAALQTTRIRLGYTRVAAGWNGGSDQRIVAERYVDEGETVSANTPLLRIVELDPVTGVISVTEKDYPFLAPGQPVTLTTDAHPNETFHGEITRIAPVFQQAARQARVELRVENPDLRLKPGLFIRASVVLRHLDDATIVPEAALTRRAEHDGLFLLDADGKRVHWRRVTVGVRDGERLQIVEPPLAGRVVTLGQQLLDEGSEVALPEEAPAKTEKKGGGKQPATTGKPAQ
ncbi:efflux RND transporter periplasmic adaptor subunit [Endothiovibrio diazotrophicus]